MRPLPPTIRLVVILLVVTGHALGQGTPPDPTNTTYTGVGTTVTGALVTSIHLGDITGTFAFPWGEPFRCGEQRTLPATRHCVTTTFSAGPNSGSATGCYVQAFTQTYTSGPCEICQIWFVYPNATLELWVDRYDVSGFVYEHYYSIWKPGPNQGLLHAGKLQITCAQDLTCPGCTLQPICDPASGDCYVDNGTPGCENSACCTSVCAMNPFCCDVAWDMPCAEMAALTCPELGGGDVGPFQEEPPSAVLDLDASFAVVSGSPPPDHPVLDPHDTLDALSPWHLCQVQTILDRAAGVALGDGTPLTEIAVLQGDASVVSLDLAADPDPLGVGPHSDFDDLAPGTDLHGVAGWRGWDDDPAFSAPVSDTVSRSGTNAVRIDGDADLVHDHCDLGIGVWSFTAWQYIPSGFVSEGTDQFAGTYFNLLNTYQDGGPYHWSVQMQFDSNDGLCKVWQGDGFNIAPIPYDTDRWREIQVVVDKEDDWTRVYYDDELVTEYPWTGGILGDGGGAPDIAVVDLFARGSSPVHYDDLRLEPVAGPDDDLLADEDGDGLSLLDEIVSGTEPGNPDTDRDTVPDGADNCPLTPNADQSDLDDDGVGDACDDTTDTCPADTNGDMQVNVTDLVNLILDWGTDGSAHGGDIDGSGTVDVADLVALVLVWGTC